MSTTMDRMYIHTAYVADSQQAYLSLVRADKAAHATGEPLSIGATVWGATHATNTPMNLDRAHEVLTARVTEHVDKVTSLGRNPSNRAIAVPLHAEVGDKAKIVGWAFAGVAPA